MTSPFQLQNLKVVNEGKAGVPILSGVGFFDHMLDQLNSHAQVGVGLEVIGGMAGATTTTITQDHQENRNRLANSNQVELCTAVGTELGKAMLSSLPLVSSSSDCVRFCCPLDEGLVECILQRTDGKPGTLKKFTLTPYGIYPKKEGAKGGRSKIGQWETFSIQSFWQALAEHAQLDITLEKIRGDNGHHIVESSFKAFSRALRNLLDSSDSKGDAGSSTLWDNGSANDQASVALNRQAKIERSTKETSISVELLLNGSSEETKVETGIPILDEFFTVLAKEASMTLKIQCKGDLWVDDHHTAEDVSIAVGQCLTEALGTKAGLNRMWLAEASSSSAGGDGVSVEVTMDLSNRPYLGHNLHDTLGQNEYVDGDLNSNGSQASPLSCEMFDHVLDSLVMNGRMTVHIVEKKTPGPTNVKDMVIATAKAFGRALRVCAMVDMRRAGQTASSKGTLSV